MTDPPKNCPQCGKTLEAEFPEPLCPACLMAGAAKPTEAGTMVDPDLQNNTVPDLTSIQAAFPQFEIIELIGRGGMGVVYKARQTHLDRLVALKILPAGNQADTAFAERFTREAKVLARLNHPNIVTLHDFGQTDDFFYLVMEYIDGVNLRQAMRAGGFSPEQALGVVPRICEALQFAHGEGILHRDIKPDNILLNSKGRIKIADFGIATQLTSLNQDHEALSSRMAESEAAHETL
ncbi:MAG: serine/threonine-protein kinase, partial [Verrucomicrobiota bacterium]